MIAANNISLNFGERNLFKDVNLKFLPGFCYGVIGANGAGKSTFIKILSGEISPTEGQVEIGKRMRIAVLQQDQFAYDGHSVLNTVIMGHERMHEVMVAREEIYAKPDFSEEDGVRAADLEGEFAEMGGYEAEADAAILLDGLGISTELHDKLMSDVEAGVKVRVLLAQVLFGSPDILLLDEPTNQLDLQSIRWLENFLANFEQTVIVVSHDRHFLNNVCTHTVDVDFGRIRMYAGNYDFWYRASELAARQRKEQGKKRDLKVKELQAFVQRFGANVAKARQTTARKKMIEQLTIDELPETARKFPYVDFTPERPAGNVIVELTDVTVTIEGEKVLDNLSLTVENGDKIALVGPSDLVKTVLLQVMMEEIEPDSGSVRWGVTITPSYFPKENSMYFASKESIVEWLHQYTTSDDETYVRGFLGRMLFSGEEALKSVNVLSGGEKVRCMLSRMMLSGANTLLFDEPTNHLDLEAITSLNDALIRYEDVVIFTSQDFQFVDTVANRIVEITPNGVIDRRMPFSQYVADDDVKALRSEMYGDVKVAMF